MAEPADHLERRQITVGDKLLELAVPFVEAPIIRVPLIVQTTTANQLIYENNFYDPYFRAYDPGGERIREGVGTVGIQP
jgi:hypothetical protein